MNTLVIEKQTGGYFKFTLNGDTANAITSIQNDLLAVGTQLHFKTGNGANIIKEQFIYPADVTIIASGTFTFTTVAQVWDKLIDIDYFAWLGGGGTGGVDRFDDLLDTFSYTGNAGKAVVVDGAELRLVPITLYNKRLFTELEDTPSSLVPNKMLVVNPAGTAVVLQDQPEQPEQLLNSVGYFDYNDLITQTIPLVAVANVALKLTNDTEGLNTSTDQNPYGVSYVWDYTTNAFNFSELEVGDTIDVRIHVQVTTTTSNQKVLLSAKFGIGSVSEFTNIIYENQFKTAGLHEVNFVAPFYMGSTYITDNPAELYLTTDASATVKVDGWYVRILRKNINIITVDYTVLDATGSVKGIVRLAGDLAGTANSPTVPELANKVPNTRTVSTTSPLLGGGALSSNLTLSIQQANSVDSGYLTYADWGRFDEAHRDRIVSAAVTGTTTKTLTLTQHDAGTITTSWTDDNTDAVSSVFGRTGAVVAVSGDYTTSLVTESTNKNYQTDNQKLYNDATSSIQTQLNSKANDNAVVHLTGAETITGKKTFDSSAGSSDAIEIISNSTGYGIKLSHPSGGTAIFVSNPVGVGLNVNNIGTNSFGISISNPSTGRAIDIGNGGAGTGISLSNSGSGYGISISNPSTGTGIFSSNTGGVSSVGISSHNTSSGTGFYSLNTSTGRGIWSANTGTYGIYSENAGAGDGIYSQNSSTGSAFSSWNSSTGIGIYSNNTSSGKGLVLNNTTAAIGMPFTISKNSVDKFTINDAGEATGVKFIKSGGTSSQFLKADGSVDSTTYQTALTNPVTGTGTSGQVAFWNGTSSQTGDSGLLWDNTNKSLTVSKNDRAAGGLLTIQNSFNGTGWIAGDRIGSLEFNSIDTSGAGVRGAIRSVSTSGSSTNASQTALAFENYNVGVLSEAARFTASNNLLVGTTTDAGFKLDVNGTARVQGILTATADSTINGVSIGKGNNSLTSNVRLGNSTLTSVTTGDSNVAIGQNALQNNTTGASNIGIGRVSLFANTTGNENVSIGRSSLEDNTSGSQNTAIGQNSLANNTTGSQNTANGISSLNANTTGNSNTAIGFNSLLNLTGTNSNNTAIGVGAGRYAGAGTTTMTSVNNSIYVGFQARGLNATGSTNEIVIGYDVVGLGSNTTVLGNSSTITTAIYGSVGIGTTSPSFAIGSGLHVKSNSGWGEIRIEGQSFAGGTGSAISFTSEGTALADIYADTDKNLSFRTNGASSSMRILANGNVGIGTTNPVSKLTINTATNENVAIGSLSTITAGRTLILQTSSTGGSIETYSSITGGYVNTLINPNGGSVGIGTTSPGTLFHIYKASFPILTIQSSSYQSSLGIDTTSGNLVLNNESNAPLSFNTNATERMRITSGGQVEINRTADLGNGFLEVNGSGSRSALACNQVSTSSSAQIYFSNPNGIVGSVTTSASLTLYNTTSDYRLKKDFKKFNGLDLVSKIKVYDYEWKSDNSRMNGVIAHELQEVLPYAVTGEKDGEQMQSVDYSKLVPVMIQAIQELKAEIEILKNK